jgi:hypothetical protein
LSDAKRGGIATAARGLLHQMPPSDSSPAARLLDLRDKGPGECRRRTSGHRWGPDGRPETGGVGPYRARGHSVTARVIVVLRDGWLQFRQIGALVPVGVVASKKNQSVRGLVLGRKPHGLLDTDKVTGVLAPAVWARPMEIVSHHTL